MFNFSMKLSLLSNLTNISSTPSLPLRGTVLVVAESSIFLILNVGAFIGNLLVCLAFYRNPSLRTVVNNFIFSLAFTDLLMAVTVMPVFTVSSLFNKWIAGYLASQIIMCCLLTALFTSTSTVMLIAINRYFQVVRPELYGSIYSKKSSARMSVAAWVAALVLVVCRPVFGVRFENSSLNFPFVHLSFSNGFVRIYNIVVNAFYITVPNFVVAVCYWRVYKTIRHHNTAVAPSSREGNSPYGVNEARITRLLTVVVVSFYLCMFPGYFFTLLSDLNLLPSSVLKYHVSLRVFPIFTSSVINPIIYGVMNQSFRLEFVKIVRCR